MNEIEKVVLIKSTYDSIVPKLVAEDISLFKSLLQAVFPNAMLPSTNEGKLIEIIQKICHDEGIIC